MVEVQRGRILSLVEAGKPLDEYLGFDRKSGAGILGDEVSVLRADHERFITGAKVICGNWYRSANYPGFEALAIPRRKQLSTKKIMRIISVWFSLDKTLLSSLILNAIPDTIYRMQIGTVSIRQPPHRGNR